MASGDFASMSNDELKAYIEDLNRSVSNVNRQLRDQTHANRVFCGSTNVRGILSEKDAVEQRRFCLQRQKEGLLTKLEEARVCLRNRQMLDK